MTQAMGSAGLGGADTTVFNETVSRATREQGADRAENHHFRQIMTQRLGWSAGQRWSSSVGRPGREAQLPGPAHSTAGPPCGVSQLSKPILWARN